MVSDSANEKKIRLGEVASALSVPPKSIRNWIGGGRFDLLTDANRKENKWREFSYFDVAHLAIAAQLIRYGFTIDEAHDFAGAALIKVLKPLLLEGRSINLENAPGGMLEAICRGRTLYVVRFTDGDCAASVTPPDDVPPYIGAACINLALCVHLAFNGLLELGHDAFSSSHPKEYTEEEANRLFGSDE